MKTAAVYIRVSTTDQTEYSPDAQLKAIREYAERNNIIISDELIFRDEGVSGRNAEKRPAFMQMIRLAKSKQRKFDLILVHKFSRFARSREDSIVYKSMLRKEYGIDVISITEPITDDKFSIVIEAMHEALDEYYSINLAGEVVKGMKEKATRGEIQTAPPFGYRKDPGQPLQIVEDEARYVRLIFDWYLAGDSYFAIARKLNTLGVRTKRGNPFENRTVEYILNNPTYKGYARWTPAKTISKRIFDSPDTIIVKSDHEFIIDEELFDRVAEKIKAEKAIRSKKERPAETKKHYLSGILKCGSCGSTLSYSQANDGFQCIKYSHGSCKLSHFIKARKAEEAILAKLFEATKTGIFMQNIRTIDENTEKVNLLQKELIRLERMMERVKMAYLNEIDTLEDYSRNKKMIQKEIDHIKDRLAEAESRIKKVDQNVFRKKVGSVIEILTGNASVPEKHSALKSIVEKIVFSRPEETISIYFYMQL